MGFMKPETPAAAPPPPPPPPAANPPTYANPNVLAGGQANRARARATTGSLLTSPRGTVSANLASQDLLGV